MARYGPVSAENRRPWALVLTTATFLLAAALVVPPPAAAQTHLSTHWTGWYDVYASCKVQGQMHWRYFSDERREVERHYWRFRKTASTHTHYLFRIRGRDSWYTMDIAYSIPSNDGYWNVDIRGLEIDSCGGKNTYVLSEDRTFRSLGPSPTHDVRVRCVSPCANFAYWRRIGIGNPGNPPGHWETLATGSYTW